jgi:hypothetical protein
MRKSPIWIGVDMSEFRAVGHSDDSHCRKTNMQPIWGRYFNHNAQAIITLT